MTLFIKLSVEDEKLGKHGNLEQVTNLNSQSSCQHVFNFCKGSVSKGLTLEVEVSCKKVTLYQTLS